MDKARILILGKNDQHHPLEEFAEMSVGWLESAGFADVAMTNNRAVITENPGDYDLLILAMTPNKLSDAEEDELVNFVDNGKKLMAIHSATVVDESNVKYIDMVGGRFARHSPHHEFSVKIADPGHPIMAGISDFKVTDELYVLDRTPSAASVLLTAFWEGDAQPILYLRAYGAGKVLYNALGHGPEAYKNPNLEKLVVQGAKWLLKQIVS